MIKRIVVLSVVGFLLIMPGWALCDQSESVWTGSLSLFAGKKFLDDDWEPLDEHNEFGAVFNFRQRSWPVDIAFDVFYSWDDDSVGSIDLDGDTLEFNIGARKVWESNKIQPFIGGGLAIIKAEIEASAFGVKVSDDDTDAGLWAECGIRYLISDQLSLGLDLRYSWVEVTLLDVDGDAGGVHLGILLGYHW